MPFRFKGGYAAPGRGVVSTDRKGRKTHVGPGPTPAGVKKVKARPPQITTVSPTGKIATTGFPTPQAASVARKQARSSQRRVRRIEAQQASALGFHRRTQQRASERVSQPSLALSKRDAPISTKTVISSKALGPGSPKARDLRAPVPSYKPPKFQGAKTVGTPTLGSLQKAQSKGLLRTNRKGYVTTPAVRKVSGTLRRLESKARRSVGPLPGLTPQQSKVARTVLRRGVKAGATRKEKLAAAETGLVESHFENLPGGTSDSQGWRQERASIYPNPRNVKAGAQRFFSEAKEQSGATAGELAANVQRPAEQYRGRYDEERPKANAIVKAFERGGLKPAQQRKLAATQAKARKLGLKTAAPDISRGPDPRFVYVRADASAAVQWAQHALGTAEGSTKQVRWAGEQGLSTTQPWCANFVSADLKRHGVPLPPNPNYVPSYESEWSGGHNIGTNLAKAKPGDLIAYSGDHIGIYKGSGKVISGNYGNEVAESAASEGPAPISAILRPNYKGGKIKVKAGTPIPGYTGGTSITSVPAGAEVALASSTPSATTGKLPQLTPNQKAHRTLKKLAQLGAGVSQPSAGATEDKGAILKQLEATYGKKAA